MYLKSLTLRGFKSFASATTLRFEPGITCVVGPNGSGKSNIVDALSWVMGEQGAKSLRGGKMEDVVFAGTTSRPPLGRAEVTLTIDNSDGALPIDYAEVTISRLMFRSGQSEYAINGDHCRLLDVQELLSDSGLGREMHVIVGQGQLDQVLHAGPEARRALIEEAAGVLKHRRRKEKALRKLEAMQANLTRLVDLTAELSRRLKPLGRQAEIARRAAVIQADLRDARLRLLADDYVTLRRRSWQRTRPTRPPCWPAGPSWRRDLATAAGAKPSWTPPRSSRRPRLAARAGDLVRAVLAGRAAARRRRPGRGAAPPSVRRAGAGAAGPRSRRARTARPPSCASRKRAWVSGCRRPRAARRRPVAERTAAEAALAATERRIADAARAAAERAERLARLRGQVERPEPGGRRPGGDRPAEPRPPSEARAPGRAGPAGVRARSRTCPEAARGRDRAGGRRTGGGGRADPAARPVAGAAGRPARRQRRPAAYAALRARAEALEEALRRGADASPAVLRRRRRFRGVLGPFAEACSSVADGRRDGRSPRRSARPPRRRGHRPERGRSPS